MAQIKVLKMDGTEAGNIELNDDIFAIEVNPHAVHAVVVNYLANQRQRIQSAKTRGEIRGGKRKPFRQKGTGRARQGSNNAPHQYGGGVAFAPKPRSYRFSVPKKVKRLALKSALSSKLADQEIIVLESLDLDVPKTKDMIKVLENINAAKKALIVTDIKNDNVVLSAANIPGVKASMVGEMNVYDIVNHESLILTRDAVTRIEEVYS